MGVSVENEDYTGRIDDLRKTGADVKFLSLEPLLGPLPRLNLHGWVLTCRSSSSNGAARSRAAPVACWMAVRGIRCHRITRPPSIRFRSWLPHSPELRIEPPPLRGR